MLTKEEKEKWLIENCLNKFNEIDLKGLDLRGYNLNTMDIKANEIYQSCQIAEKICQHSQQAHKILQGNQFAETIEQDTQRANNIYIQSSHGYNVIYDKQTDRTIYKRKTKLGGFLK